MRSRAPALLLAVCALAAAGLTAIALADERELAFTTNVRVVQIVAVAAPGEQACQTGVAATASFDTVELFLGTGTLPGPPLEVTVRQRLSGRMLARGHLAPGARDNRPARVRLDRTVEEGPVLEICLRNMGRRNVGFYGGPDPEAPGSTRIDRAAGAPPVGGAPGLSRPGSGDLRIGFLRSEPRSAFALVPDMFERATMFRPEPVGAWTFWLLLGAVALGVPLLLAAALRAVARLPHAAPPRGPAPHGDPPDPA